VEEDMRADAEKKIRNGWFRFKWLVLIWSLI
jgi:hypothetical protein